LGESNLDGVDPEDRMATVEVDDVAFAPRELGDLRGQTVTVYLATTEGLEPEQELTFFARSWHYGQNLGVIEIGRTTSPVAEIRRPLIQERLRQLDELIEERIRTAEAIISGHVLATYPAEQTEGLPGVLEGVHWWNADMWIGSVEKGSPPEDKRIWFPEGGEPEWGIVPKAYPGQTGVWLLRPVMDVSEYGAGGEQSPQHGYHQSPQTQFADRAFRGRLMAVDPLDYHASSALPRIQTLLSLALEG
jgi:hypothetical protein